MHLSFFIPIFAEIFYRYIMETDHYSYRKWIIGGFAILFSLLLLVSCEKKTEGFTAEQRKAAEFALKGIYSPDTLEAIQHRMQEKGDVLGSIVVLREWGRILRNESRFDEALRVHSEGLRQAEAVHDTIEWVRALNNIGTNYRRLGILDAAQEYHYLAWKMSEASTDTTFQAKKNKVISLNGLGNIYLSLGNYERADSVLRKALAGEKELNSLFGQAINYANLATIFKNKAEIDSAWVYYRKSMDLNTKAKNKLGISLGHTYYGELYEIEGKYEKAYAEYEKALEMMKASKDEWHALTAQMALAHIDYVTGKDEDALKNLNKAETTARKIKSREHLAEIYDLYYRIYERQGRYEHALKSHLEATALKDSVVGTEKMNRIQNVSLNIERRRQVEQMNHAKQVLEQERGRKRMIAMVAIGVVLLLVILILSLSYIQRIRTRSYNTLKKMNLLRENFFTNITHEFRTPLTVILGSAQDIINHENASKTIKDKAKSIEQQGKNLLTFINQLLDISKIKSAVGDPDWRSGNISAYIAMIVESYRDYAHSQKIDLHFLSRGDIQMDFVPHYINKILNNLLSNAFKFTPKYGKVDVSVWQEDNKLFLEVSDTGIGISASQLPHLFEMFYQAEGESSNIGSGIGLSLVKQIVDSVGGTINVTSEEKKGSTFLITIPIKQGQKPYEDFAANETTNTPMLPKEQNVLQDSNSDDDDNQRILIIEDNSDIAAYIGEHLTDKYAVFYASNGKEGLDKANALVPDLIITDLMMPEINGLEVCRQVRRNEVINHIPIIVITAKTSETDRIKGLEAGADAYLAKPFNSDELLTRVEKLLEQRRSLREKYLQLGVLGSVETKEKDQESEKTKPPTKIAETELNMPDQQFLTKMVDYVYLMLDKNEEIDINLIASNMYMSSRQFYRKVSALTGSSPQAYIQRVRIHKAKQLLDKNPQLPLKEVSERCGFSDYSNFVRSFKNVCGITPTQYLRQVD